MPDLHKDDQVTISFDTTIPFIVRPCAKQHHHCNLVGAAYGGGIMNGEVVDELYCEDLLDSTTLYVQPSAIATLPP